MPRNKLCVHLTGPFNIRREVKNKDIILKSVTMADSIMGWFKIMQYEYKRLMTIVNLVQTTCITRFPWSMKITYDQGSEFIDNEFRKSLIEKE